MLKRLLPYMKPHVLLLVASTAITLLELGANILLPWLTGRIIDWVFRSPEPLPQRAALLQDLLLYLILGLIVVAICVYLRGYFAERFSQKIIKGIRIDLFSHMQRLDMNFYRHNTLGELMSRATSDIEQLRNFCLNGLMMSVLNGSFFTIAVIYMLFLNWQLTLLCMLVSPIIAALALRFSFIGKRNQRYNRQAYADLSAVAQEGLNGIRLIQNFVSQDYEIERFDEKNRNLTWGRQRSLRNWAKYMPILEVLGSFSNILALTVGGYMVIRGQFSLGTWVQFSSYTWMLVSPMRQLGELISTINFAKVSSERIFSIMDEELCIQSPAEPQAPSVGKAFRLDETSRMDKAPRMDVAADEATELNSLQEQKPLEIEFRSVTWYAPQKEQKAEEQKNRAEATPVLRDVTLKIPAGTSLGIIGETGAGKTTMADLICRFADPSSGSILMDGVDLREWDLHALRARVSYVMQEPFLFSDTLSYNIGFDQTGISQDRIIRSAQRSAAHSFIGMMAQGYQTVVGERGVDLSGGQRQRTALARALVKEAPILILDDTTSAVDLETEREIQEQLQDTESHYTRIIIAHRLSSVAACDQIIALKDGAIVERGTHASLMQEGGYYYRTFCEQQMLG